MNRNLFRTVVLGAAALVMGGCQDTLVVQNPNSGETDRVLSTPNDAEALLGSYYRRWSSGVYGRANLEGMANIYALMNYSSLANDGQNSHAPFSGSTNYNSPGNTVQGEQFRLFSILSEVNRVASSFNGRLDAGLNLGSPARNARARSFADFLNGISLGYIALMHDSGAVVSSSTGGLDAGTLVSYTVVMDSALAALQRSIDVATAPAVGDNGFPLPPNWISSPTTFSQVEFVRLVKTYRARLRANVARTPAERAAVNWAAVITDALEGITATHQITTSTTTGPGNSWRSQYGTFGLWHQVPAFFIGMADVSGSYAAWIGTPLGDRGAGNVGFFMSTPDLRFPQGATRAAQQADFLISTCAGASQVCRRYFVNRNGNDQYAGLGWGWSNYDHARFHSWRTAGAGTQQNGPTPFFVVEELNLLRAEGLYRTGQFAAAGAIVNATRVLNGLPAITAFDATSPVPGGGNCVPKVPSAAAPTAVSCGNLWEALKYEKRIETAYTSYAPWYLDGRGWGDLPATTPLYWAVPFQELLARSRPISAIYGAGIGSGNAPNSSAGPSGYGW